MAPNKNKKKKIVHPATEENEEAGEICVTPKHPRRHTGGKGLMLLVGRRAIEREITRSKRSAKAKRGEEDEMGVNPLEFVLESRFREDNGTDDEDENMYETGKRKRDDSWLVDSPMVGGPCDDSLIPSFQGRVASRIWDGNDRDVLKLRICGL